MHITEMGEDNRYSSLALNSFEQGLKACLSGGGGSQVGEETRLGLVICLSLWSLMWLPQLSWKRDQIEMRDYMDRRPTQPKRDTSPTWGPLHPCKQTLRESNSCVKKCHWKALIITMYSILTVRLKWLPPVAQSTFHNSNAFTWNLWVFKWQMTAKNIPTVNVLKTTLINLLGVKKCYFFNRNFRREKECREWWISGYWCKATKAGR